jgi:hypothetical protein
VLEAADDQLGLALYWRADGHVHWARLRDASAQASWERALVYARRAGVRRLEVDLEGVILNALVSGPTPIDVALPQAESVLRRAAPGSLLEASAQRVVGKLRSCQGFFEEARDLHTRARQTLRDAGQYVSAAGQAMSVGDNEWRAGNLVEQERVLRESVEILSEIGDQYYYSTVALELAECLLRTRPPDDPEIAEICSVARERSLAGDLVNFVFLDGIEARRLAVSGSRKEASGVARRAVENAETTENFEARSVAWQALAETLVLVDEPEEALVAAITSLDIRKAKGDVAGVAALERRYTELGVRPA